MLQPSPTPVAPSGARSQRWTALLAPLLIALSVALGWWQVQPPAPAGEGAPEIEFAAARASGHLPALASQPHPVGTPANRAVRDYIIQQLRALGLEPEVQETLAVMDMLPGRVQAARVANVLVRIPGTANTRALLLSGHYDSVTTGPGAADNAATVAAMLETARAVTSGPPLRNDLILLFDDAEEVEMAGSHAFITQHPWAKEIGLALNFEARGAQGATRLNATSAQNGWLVREYADAAPNPLGESIAMDVQRLMPTSDNGAIYERSGIAFMDLSFMGGWPAYHTAVDSVERLDPRSLQSQGATMLALVRRFGQLDLTETRAPDRVFFPLLGRMLGYPTGWTLPLAALVLVLVGVCFYRRRGAPGALLLGMCAALLTAVAAAAVAWPVTALLPHLTGRPLANGNGAFFDAPLYLWLELALALAVSALLFPYWRRRLQVADLLGGATLLFGLVAAVLAFVLPSGMALAVIPALAGALALLALPAAEGARPLRTLMAALLPLVALLLLVPQLLTLADLLPLTLFPALAAGAALLFALHAFHLEEMTVSRPWLWPTAGVALAALLLTLALVRLPGQPRFDSLAYFQAESGQGSWVSFDRQTDGWTASFFPRGATPGRLDDFLSAVRNGNRLLKAEAPGLGLPAPEAAVLSDTTIGDRRTVRLHLTSPRSAWRLYLFATQPQLLAASIDGRSVQSQSLGSGFWMLRYSNLPPEGVELTLQVKAGQKVELGLFDQSLSLPTLPGYPAPVRPAGFIGQPHEWEGSTLAFRTYRF